MNKWLWILLLPFLIGADYVCFDKEGVITERAYSVGARYSQREDCMAVRRTTIEGLTRWHRIVDGKVVELSQIEKDTILQDENNAKQAEDDAARRKKYEECRIIEPKIIQLFKDVFNQQAEDFTRTGKINVLTNEMITNKCLELGGY